MELYSINFCFENCEVITIPARYIFFLDYEGVHTRRRIESPGYHGISNRDIVDDITIGVLSEANIGDDVAGNMLENYRPPKGHHTVTDRISSNDLVSITIGTLYDGDSNIIKYDHYYVHWVGDDDYENEGVSTYMNENRDVLVRACKAVADNKELVFEHFPKKDMDDKEKMHDIKRHARVDWMDEER